MFLVSTSCTMARGGPCECCQPGTTSTAPRPRRPDVGGSCTVWAA